MRSLAGRLDLCAVNTASLGFQQPLAETIELVARAGFGAIAPWRREVEGLDAAKLGRLMRDAGLRVTGYCRSTYIPALDLAGFNANIEVNRKAIADAAALGAESFVMVVGGLPAGSKDMAGARAQVKEGIALLLETGKTHGVKIALEPLHPVYAAERSCLSLISEAVDLCEALEPEGAAQLGVCLDVYHIWWDPHLQREINRASGRIIGFHVCDWLVPTQDVLNDRGMMGDGVIDIPLIRSMVEEAGYRGFIEAEIFSSETWWKRPPAETLEVLAQRFQSSV